MRRTLWALALLAVLAVACGGQTEPAAAPFPSPSPVASPEASPPTAALTGAPLTDPAALTRPVLAVKVDNALAARPPLGRELADIVIEELVEGGFTRFIALYHSTNPGTVGPVRSGREVDALLLPPFAPVVAVAGAAPPTREAMQAAGLRVLDETSGGGALHRVRDRRGPHNLVAEAPGLWAAGAGLPPASPPWPFDPAVPAGGGPAAAAQRVFPPKAAAAWTWDPAGGAWLRDEDGAPHVAASGQRLAAHNVVVARVPVSAGGGQDVRGTPTVNIQVLGEGDALVLRDGQALTARWRKVAPTAHFEWLTP
ncbi:MAG TPA: DUF3048 domain-containing protein, partial [Egibacteraceae bacterium]|nr:DUF3048 domain-containing protein [Egibacteraceae bacterium]